MVPHGRLLMHAYDPGTTPGGIFSRRRRKGCGSASCAPTSPRRMDSFDELTFSISRRNDRQWLRRFYAFDGFFSFQPAVRAVRAWATRWDLGQTLIIRRIFDNAIFNRDVHWRENVTEGTRTKEETRDDIITRRSMNLQQDIQSPERANTQLITGRSLITAERLTRRSLFGY